MHFGLDEIGWNVSIIRRLINMVKSPTSTYVKVHNICRYNVVDRCIEYHDWILQYKYYHADKVNFHMDLFLNKNEEKDIYMSF